MTTKNVKFTDLLDCPASLIPNDLIAVHPDGFVLTQVTAGSVIIPSLGTGTQNHVVKWGSGVVGDILEDTGIIVNGVGQNNLNNVDQVNSNNNLVLNTTNTNDQIKFNINNETNFQVDNIGNTGIDSFLRAIGGNAAININGGILALTMGNVLNNPIMALGALNPNVSTPLDPPGLHIIANNTQPIVLLLDMNAGNFLGFQCPPMPSSAIFTLPAQDGANGDVLTTNGGGQLTFQPSSGGTTMIPCMIIKNNGQIIAPTTQANIQGNVSNSYGLGGWAVDTFTSAGGLFEMNLSVSVQVGTSPNNSLYVSINGGAPQQVLGYIYTNATSYSSIFNLALGDTLNFVWENDDLALNAVLFNTTLTIKRINNFQP